MSNLLSVGTKRLLISLGGTSVYLTVTANVSTFYRRALDGR